jgi:hypothetical protein
MYLGWGTSKKCMQYSCEEAAWEAAVFKTESRLESNTKLGLKKTVYYDVNCLEVAQSHVTECLDQVVSHSALC